MTNHRDRQAELAKLARLEREAEREHQQALLTSFLSSLETIQRTSAQEAQTTANAMIEVAKSVAAQANGFAEWMKCFQPGAAPTSSIVRDEDEYAAEQQRMFDAGMPNDLAPEFQLAWVMANDPNLIET